MTRVRTKHGQTLSREDSQAWLKAPNKALNTDGIRMSWGERLVIEIDDSFPGQASLVITIDRDGNLSMQAYRRDRGAIHCRFDQKWNAEAHMDAESGEPVEGPHKHYHDGNIDGKQRVVNRGEEHIPLNQGLKSALIAFLEEINIQSPAPERISITETRRLESS